MTEETLNPKLQELLDKDELDWDNPRHRAAYVKEWLKAPRKHQEEEFADDPQA
jgi:hypothetical protein